MPALKAKYKPDFIIINGENSAAGKGVTETEAKVFFELGAKVITTGNHVWDNWGSKPLLASNDAVLRPANYPPGNIGNYMKVTEIEGTPIAVVQIQGRTFMYSIDCPFRAMNNILKSLKKDVKVIIVDFHADATAEKIAMGWHLDGRVSALLGTHTHVPTADACILPNGTAYISDAGMTGPYNSVLGMSKEVALKRFTLQTAHKFQLADGDSKICGVNVVVDAETGQAISIESFVEPKFVTNIYDEVQNV